MMKKILSRSRGAWGFAAEFRFGLLALGCAVSIGSMAVAAERPGREPASGQAQVAVSGFGRGYTNEGLRRLIQEGVDLAMAGQAAGTGAPLQQARWAFSIQTNTGNRPETLIVANLESGRGRTVTDYFQSATLGTSPPRVFVGEVQVLANRLIAEATAQPL